MTIAPSDAVGHVEHRGHTYYFCHESCLERFSAAPESFLSPAPATPAPAGQRRGHARVHVPDGSGGPPDRPRRVPEVRHGARAGDGQPGRRGQPRARRHDAALPRLARAHAADPRLHDLGRPARAAAAARHVAGGDDLDAVRAGLAGRAVGRLAVLRPRLGVGGEPPPEHVHADRARRRRRLRLQRGRDARARAVPGVVPRPRRSGRRLLRAGGGHRHARAPRPGAGAARPQPDERGDQGPARPRAVDGPSHRRVGRGDRRAARARPRRRSAARAARRARSRSTASCWRAAPASTSRW